MRKWAISIVPVLLVFCVMATPACAAKLLSVDQMEDFLARFHGKSDGKVASELDDVQLTERVTAARLAKWETQFPGPRTHEELMRLADLSAFQKPATDDLLRDPEPDADTQVQILTSAAHYVRATIARLPDFFATRDTTHFESLVSQHMAYAMQSQMDSGKDEHASLSSITARQTGVDTSTEIEAMHSAGQFSTTVTYRDGHEIVGEETGKQKKEPNFGLTSRGEFGPILAVIVGDALQSKISWMRWEQTAGEPAAVFQFSVPEDKSHFRVTIAEGGKAVALTPAYHGEIEIDPGTGEILRLSEIADMAPPRQSMRAGIIVEFGPVTVGSRSYICPVRSIAFSRFPAPNAATGSDAPMQTQLNDVAFTDYHEFRSEMRILANNGDANPPAANPAAANPPAPAETAANTPPASQPPPPNSPEASASNAPPAAAPQPETPPSSSPAPAAPAEASAPPANAAAAPSKSASAPAPAAPDSSAPAMPAPATPAPVDANGTALPSGPIFRTSTQLVLVDVVVTNHDHPVDGLTRDHFHIFEDGHEVSIASFDAITPAASAPVSAPPALPPNTYSNQPTYPDTGAVNVLLLDALNTPMADQEQVRRTMIDYLGSVRPGTPLAIFTLSSRLRMAAGFTTDSAQLLKALQGAKAAPHTSTAVGTTRGQDLSTDITHAASSVATSSDPGARWLVGQIMQFAADTKTYDTDQRERMTLEALRQLAAYLAGVPGRKNVIWFSGSFPTHLWPNAGGLNGSVNQRDYTYDMQQASIALTAARVSIYPVDARGILTAPTTDASYMPPPTGPPTIAMARDNQNFSADKAQDQGTITSIASETGGHVYSAGNDLKKAVEKIVAADSSYYAISYAPPEHKDTAHSDRFHTIEVKVDGGYQLSYRQGYYENQPTNAPSSSGNAPAPMLAAAMPGAPSSTQILFQARVVPQSNNQAAGSQSPAASALAAGPAGSASNASSANGPRTYSVDLSIDPRSLSFSLSQDDTRHAQLQCALVAFDSNDKQLNSLSRTLAVHLSPQQWDRIQTAGATLPVHLSLDLPTGEIALRIVVYDMGSTHTGSLEIPVDVGTGAAPHAGQ